MNDRHLSFSQRNGLSAIPPQMIVGEINDHLKAKLWQIVRRSIHGEAQSSYTEIFFGQEWKKIWEDWCVEFAHKIFDSDAFEYFETLEKVKKVVSEAHFNVTLDFIEFVCNHRTCPSNLRVEIPNILRDCRAAYRFVDNLIVPISDQHEVEGITSALAEISASDAQGAKSHMASAAGALRNGNWATSIRESITAVESAARNAAPGTKDLKSALNELSKSGHLKHKALQSALNQLYGYTSDEQGIRHALVFKGEADADEAEAVFMFGACASFASYLVKLSGPKN